ncbi:MAG TPA: hypothetical protein VF665_24255 [Longimicrobium sp.]|uniref:hypothetical protein n=1 Tax=Longimicrobium sp. TaxID=2029185 RepID=UPI002ED99784
MDRPDPGARKTVVLVDTNVIIEAVRTACWNALAGGRTVETVRECRDETQRGNPHRPGYVTVGAPELGGLAAVHDVTEAARARLALQYADAPGMDPGERDLMAHALDRVERGDRVWVACSPDHATVRAASALDLADHLASLEQLADSVGARPARPLKTQFLSRWLSDSRLRHRPHSPGS